MFFDIYTYSAHTVEVWYNYLWLNELINKICTVLYVRLLFEIILYGTVRYGTVPYLFSLWRIKNVSGDKISGASIFDIVLNRKMMSEPVL